MTSMILLAQPVMTVGLGDGPPRRGAVDRPARRGRPRHRRHRRGDARAEREPDQESAAGRSRSVNVVPTPSSLATSIVPPQARDRGVGRRQAEAGPEPLRLGREERLEDPRPGRLVHARCRCPTPSASTIGSVGRGGHPGRDPDRPAVRHRVPGVDDEVHEDVLELGGVGERGRDRRIRAGPRSRSRARRCRPSIRSTRPTCSARSTGWIWPDRVRLNVEQVADEVRAAVAASSDRLDARPGRGRRASRRGGARTSRGRPTGGCRSRGRGCPQRGRRPPSSRPGGVAPRSPRAGPRPRSPRRRPGGR